MRCLCHCWRPTTSISTRASSTSRGNMRRCTSSARSSSFLLSPCSLRRPRRARILAVPFQGNKSMWQDNSSFHAFPRILTTTMSAASSVSRLTHPSEAMAEESRRPAMSYIRTLSPSASPLMLNTTPSDETATLDRDSFSSAVLSSNSIIRLKSLQGVVCS